MYNTAAANTLTHTHKTVSAATIIIMWKTKEKRVKKESYEMKIAKQTQTTCFIRPEIMVDVAR